MDKDYLGDSVYVENLGDGRLELTTRNGLPDDPSNLIVLEPEVLEALDRYRERLRQVTSSQKSP